MKCLIALGVMAFFAMASTGAVAGVVLGAPGTVAPAKNDKKAAEARKDAVKDKAADKHKDATKHKADDKVKPKAPEKSADPKGGVPAK